jgi:hypothetical protein
VATVVGVLRKLQFPVGDRTVGIMTGYEMENEELGFKSQ